MTPSDVATMLTDLPGVTQQVAGPQDGAPEIAWGDSFFFYEPDGQTDRRFPFATLVTKDYPGFDTASELDRPGVYRLNLSVGRERFTQLFGCGPEQFEDHRGEFDFAALDTLVPHPVYAVQSWVCVLVPGERTAGQLRDLTAYAHERAVRRHR